MKTARKVRVAAWSVIAFTLAVMVNSTYAIDLKMASTTHLRGGLYYLYASEPAQAAVAVTNPSDLVTVASIKSSAGFAHFAVSPDGRLLYATAFGNSSQYLFLIALPTFQLVATTPVGNGAHHLTLSPDGRVLYVAAAGEGMIAVVGTKSNSLQAKLSVGGAPQDVAVSSKYNLVLVANSALDSVQAVDPRTGSVVTSAHGLGRPVKLSISGDQSYLVVTGENSTTLAVLALPDLKLQSSIRLGDTAHQLYLDSDHGLAYVGLQNNSLSLVSLKSDRVLKNIPLSGVVMDLIADRSLGRIYASAGTHITAVNVDDFAISNDVDLGTAVHGMILVPGAALSLPSGSPGLRPSSAGRGNSSNFTCGG